MKSRLLAKDYQENSLSGLPIQPQHIFSPLTCYSHQPPSFYSSNMTNSVLPLDCHLLPKFFPVSSSPAWLFLIPNESAQAWSPQRCPPGSCLQCTCHSVIRYLLPRTYPNSVIMLSYWFPCWCCSISPSEIQHWWGQKPCVNWMWLCPHCWVLAHSCNSVNIVSVNS